MRHCRVLCLHGRYQTGSIFQEKLRHAYETWDQIEREYECVFVDAPHRTKPKVLRGERRYRGTRAKQSNVGNKIYREWWPDTRSASGASNPPSAQGADTDGGIHAHGSATPASLERAVVPAASDGNEKALLDAIAATLRGLDDGGGASDSGGGGSGGGHGSGRRE